VRPFQDLIVWRKAHELALSIYAETKAFPREELYGLTSQLRRAAASVPSNIAEGSARGGAKEFGQFLAVALGSATEVEYQLLLARDLGYLTEPSHRLLEGRLVEVKKMLVSLRSRVLTPATNSQG